MISRYRMAQIVDVKLPVDIDKNNLPAASGEELADESPADISSAENDYGGSLVSHSSLP